MKERIDYIRLKTAVLLLDVSEKLAKLAKLVKPNLATRFLSRREIDQLRAELEAEHLVGVLPPMKLSNEDVEEILTDTAARSGPFWDHDDVEKN